MNRRPRLSNYQADDDYVDDLEKYCDELERKYADLLRDYSQECKKNMVDALTYEALKGALIQACHELNYFQSKLIELEKKVTILGSEYCCGEKIEPRKPGEWFNHLMRKGEENDK